MPIFVDHAGLNTLITDDLDLETNTFLPQSRTRNKVDKAITAIGTESRLLTYFTLNPVFPTSGGLTFSFWINMNEDFNKHSDQSIFRSHQNSSSKEAVAIGFDSNELYVAFRNNSGTEKRWIYDSIVDTELTGKWHHIYIAWGGDFANNPSVYLDGVYQLHSSTAGSATGATLLGVDFFGFFNDVEQTSKANLHGALQSFTILSVSGAHQDSFYNSGQPLKSDDSPHNTSDCYALYFLGNEKDEDTSNFDLHPLVFGDTIPLGTFIKPITGSLKANDSGALVAIPTDEGTFEIVAGVENGRFEDQSSGSFVGRVRKSLELASITTHRNGPYGFSTWQQTRIGQNPITRNHAKNNTLTFVTEPGIVRNIFENGEVRVRDQYSSLKNFKEPCVTKKGYPLVWNVGRHFKDSDGNIDLDNPQRFSILSSYGNELLSFSNDKVDKLLNFDIDESRTEYNAITEMYLENGLNKADSPLTHWEFLYYREQVFPIATNQFRLHTRNRPHFESFYRHDRRNRSVVTAPDTPGRDYNFPSDKRLVYGPLSGNRLTQSTWPMDASINFITEQKGPAAGVDTYAALVARGNGILNSSLGLIMPGLHSNPGSEGLSITGDLSASVTLIDDFIFPSPLYSRQNTLQHTCSISNPSGMAVPATGGLSHTGCVFGEGYAKWEAGDKREVRNFDESFSSSARQPFYDSYEDYVNEVRNVGKNYSVIPEFRMSSQIADYLRTDGDIELDMFEITGALFGIEDSSKDSFFEVYSNTDFMKHFEVIVEDHKDFRVENSNVVPLDVLSLRCKAIKKFLPYEGFYPCQRTADLALQFYNSYEANIKTTNEHGENLENFNYGKSFVMTPLFRPGVLFNTIKSGIAVDYPIMTGSTLGVASAVRSDDHGLEDEFVINDPRDFEKRIPFEALVEPADHLSKFELISNEPHPSASISSSAEWDGSGDQLYPLMANNFLAECINFFLPEGQLTAIASKQASEIKIRTDKVYGMRVKMRRSMSGPRPVAYHSGSGEMPYFPPQDLIKTGSNKVSETFTMYSRPSAFGPPTRGFNFTSIANSSFFVLDDLERIHTADYSTDSEFEVTDYFMDSRTGFNYPFTPPYYHGEAWCDIILTGSDLSPDSTIRDFQESASYSFTRFDNTHLTSTGTNHHSSSGPQGVFQINNNAVQLSSSLNLKGFGTIQSEGTAAEAGSIIVDTGFDEGDRWIIQTKFETPMLNFNHLTEDLISLPNNASESVPRGMWHQYGRIPTNEEGVFLSVGPIPINYQKVVMNTPDSDLVEDLSQVLGFSGLSTKIGRLALSKEISEAVVAVPFIESEGRRKFFRVDSEKVARYKRWKRTGDNTIYNSLIEGEPNEQIGRSLLSQMEKMEKFIFPPSFDFLNFNKVTPIAMYVFEFTHTLSQRDLQDIWQNIPPEIGEVMETQEIAITHPLLKKELLGNGSRKGNKTIPMPERLRWMVFKVKQRASDNYFEKTVLRNSKLNQKVSRQNVTIDPLGRQTKFQYNWPYDFFSMVEMVKIDAETEIGTVSKEELENYTSVIPDWVPKQADRDKISSVVGGIEEFPIFESTVPAEVDQDYTPEPPHSYQDEWFKARYPVVARQLNSYLATGGSYIDRNTGLRVSGVLINSNQLGSGGTIDVFGSDVFAIVLQELISHIEDPTSPPTDRPAEAFTYYSNRVDYYIRWAKTWGNENGLPWEQPADPEVGSESPTERLVPSETDDDGIIGGGIFAGRITQQGAKAGMVDAAEAVGVAEMLVNRFTGNDMSFEDYLGMVGGTQAGGGGIPKESEDIFSYYDARDLINRYQNALGVGNLAVANEIFGQIESLVVNDMRSLLNLTTNTGLQSARPVQTDQINTNLTQANRLQTQVRPNLVQGNRFIFKP